MARLINISINKDDAVGACVVLTLDDGQTVTLSYADAGAIKQNLLLHELREAIGYALDDAIGDDEIDLNKYDGTREEFIDEIYVDLEDDVYYGEYPSEEYIKEKISDLCNFYDLEPDDNDEED